jgi:hypothetical protein
MAFSAHAWRTVAAVPFALGSLALVTGAQDSVSKLGTGLPGDAVSPYSTSEQRNDYVVDLTPIHSSWGNRFGIAPIVKSSKAGSAFFNGLISAQGASPDQLVGVDFPSSTYSRWYGPGFGVNDDGAVNDPGTTITIPPGLKSNQFGVAFAEFDTTDFPTSYNGVIGALVNYRPHRPDRLYVSRRPAATNGSNDTENLAQFGFGVMDANGNAHFRADDFSTDTSSVVGNNIFRVDISARSATAINLFDVNGASDAASTVGVVTGSSETWNTPGAIPESIAGRPVYTGSNFASDYAYEATTGAITTTQAHLGTSSDHRGSVSFSKTVIANPAFSGSVGTAALYGKDAGDETRRFLLWGVDNTGAVTGQLEFDPPTTVAELLPPLGYYFPFYVGVGTPDSIGEFIHHLSQTAFRGGNGQVAVGTDQAGNVLIATIGSTRDTDGTGSDPYNAVIVGRFDPADPAGTIAWSLAGYIDPTLIGKSIVDGPGGNVVGQLARLADVTGGTPTGPSITAPMIDSVGNVWFIAAATNFQTGSTTTTLIRAVYDEASFSFQLERIAEVGQVVRGRNSGRNYIISFTPIADSNSIDSAAAFSGNMIETAAFGGVPGSLATDDPRTFGGLVWNATIVYDVDGDGDFDTSAGPDESYDTLLYVGPIDPPVRPLGPVPGVEQ